jgi:cysteinyl-tRNA synthetase
MKYLGESFDIHGGGLDNQFPHHECEIAQSEALTSKPFVKYWLHNNLVTTKGQKMGKSLGNFLTLQDAFKIYDPLAIRFFVLQSHYRSILDFSDEALNAAAIGLEKLHNSVKNLRNELYRRNATTSSMERVLHEHPITKRFIEAMDDDFGTPQALAVLFELAHNTNQALALSSTATESLVEFDTLFRELGGKVLGIIPETITSKISMNLESKLIDLAIQVRSEARKQKLFTFSDLVRNGLKKLGIILEDSKDGKTWKLTKSDNAKNDTK